MVFGRVISGFGVGFLSYASYISILRTTYSFLLNYLPQHDCAMLPSRGLSLTQCSLPFALACTEQQDHMEQEADFLLTM